MVSSNNYDSYYSFLHILPHSHLMHWECSFNTADGVEWARSAAASTSLSGFTSITTCMVPPKGAAAKHLKWPSCYSFCTWLCCVWDRLHCLHANLSWVYDCQYCLQSPNLSCCLWSAPLTGFQTKRFFRWETRETANLEPPDLQKAEWRWHVWWSLLHRSSRSQCSLSYPRLGGLPAIAASSSPKLMPACLPACLPTYLRTCLPTYLLFYFSIYSIIFFLSDPTRGNHCK